MGKKIKVFCTDFGDIGFNNYIMRLIRQNFDVEISEEPDVLLYGPFGREFLNFDSLRIYYTGENTRPNFKECDFAFSFDHHENPRNFRFPDYAAYGWDLNRLTREKNLERILAEKTRFCSFVYSNPVPQERIRFFRMLSRYRHIDSFGGVLNNMPDAERSAERDHPRWQAIKVNFLRQCKFSIVFENESYPGYVTEKIAHALLADTIPIYWGNPLIHQDFNTRAFINCHDFKNFRDVIDRVIEIDRDEGQYRRMLNEPCFIGNKRPDCIREETLLRRLRFIFENIGNIEPVCRKNRVSTPKEIDDSLFDHRDLKEKIIYKCKAKFFELLYVRNAGMHFRLPAVARNSFHGNA